MTALVYGSPATMGSKRAFVSKSGKPIVVDDNSKKLRSFQDAMREAMRETAPATPHLGPIALSMIVWVQRPKSHYGTGKNANVLKQSAPRFVIVKPDLSKILRAVEDCGSGLWYRDDAQIARFARVDKRYAEAGEEPRVWVQAAVLAPTISGQTPG